LGFLFCQQTRESLYNPSYQALLKDYLETRKARFRTKWARRWLDFCFYVRTIGLFMQCWGISWRVAIVGFAIACGPKWLTALLRPFFQDQ